MFEKFTMSGPRHRTEIKKKNNIFKTHTPLLQNGSKNSKNRNKDRGGFQCKRGSPEKIEMAMKKTC